MSMCDVFGRSLFLKNDFVERAVFFNAMSTYKPESECFSMLEKHSEVFEKHSQCLKSTLN